ncbi:MAG: insulinase family protein [Holosporaceae bacterium]|nr:insulinase family protein [Holosporaceae bacterium]
MMKNRLCCRIFVLIVATQICVQQRVHPTAPPTNVVPKIAVSSEKNSKIEKITRAKQLKTNRGIKLFFVKNDSTQLTHIAINFRNSGAAYMEKGKTGIPSFYSSTIYCGSGKYSRTQRQKAFSDISCSINCSADQDSLSFFITMPKVVTQEAIPLISSFMNEPRFEKDEVRDILASSHSPYAAFNDQMYALIFKSHPYGNGFYGKDEDFVNFTVDDLKKYKDKYLTVANAEVCICGNLTDNEAIQLVDNILSKTKNGEANADTIVDSVPEIKPDVKRYYVDEVQSTITFVQKGVPKKSAKRYAAMLLYRIIGSGEFKSRMISELRTKLGLIYGGHISAEHMKHADLHHGMLRTDNSKVEKAINAMKNILKQARSGSITQSDLDFAKHNLKGSTLVKMRTSYSVFHFFYGAMIRDLGENALEDFLNGIEAVTLKDVHDIAQELLDEKNILFMVVGGKCEQKKP